MGDTDFGDFFISDVEDDVSAEEEVVPPAVVPVAAVPAPPQATTVTPAPPTAPQVSEAPAPAESSAAQSRPAESSPAQPSAIGLDLPASAPFDETAPSASETASPASTGAAAAALADMVPAVRAEPTSGPASVPVTVIPPVRAREGSREERLAQALNNLMLENIDIQAAALVSLDGFTMASALPEGMHEDRVGAMSAAILGLGERAAAELGRGSLSQVFIEGDGGYVVLIAAGPRAVLTALADPEAKLGLVLYDMRDTADAIEGILG